MPDSRKLQKKGVHWLEQLDVEYFGHCNKTYQTKLEITVICINRELQHMPTCTDQSWKISELE